MKFIAAIGMPHTMHHARVKGSKHKYKTPSSSIFQNLTMHVSQTVMVQLVSLLDYGLKDLEFESWQGKDFTKQRMAVGPSQPPI